MSDWVSPESHEQVCDSLARTIIERDRLCGALAVFAEPGSWVTAPIQDIEMFCWNKMGDFANPAEFARRALEGE